MNSILTLKAKPIFWRMMPNLTSPQYWVMYEIYPNKACINEASEACLSMRILDIGRTLGKRAWSEEKTQQKVA
jgi:hypothetical protein